MTLTPRQISAYLSFSFQLDRSEQANALGIAWNGAQGDQKAIERMFKELTAG